MTHFFRSYVLHNLRLKVLSVLLATGLWFAISHDQPWEVALRVPIEFQHVPENLEISSETIPEPQVRVSGPERLIRQLRSTDVHAEIELADAKPGERTFDLTAQQIRLPRDLKMVQVVPGQVHLSFDAKLTREVAIHARVTGLAAGSAKIVVDPPTITITGPQRHVEKVEAATTDPIEATGIANSTTFTSNAYVSDPLVQVVNPAPIRVTVIVGKVAPPTAGH